MHNRASVCSSCTTNPATVGAGIQGDYLTCPKGAASYVQGNTNNLFIASSLPSSGSNMKLGGMKLESASIYPLLLSAMEVILSFANACQQGGPSMETYKDFVFLTSALIKILGILQAVILTVTDIRKTLQFEKRNRVMIKFEPAEPVIMLSSLAVDHGIKGTTNRMWLNPAISGVIPSHDVSAIL